MNCRNWRKRKYRKDEADSNVISTMICTILAAVIFYLMITVMLDHVKLLETQDAIGSACDAALEGMMADGYLTSEREQQLKTRLTDLGVKGIAFVGTDRAPVDYGEALQLCVQYTISLRTHQITNLLSPDFGSEEVTFQYERTGTSYH